MPDHGRRDHLTHRVGPELGGESAAIVLDDADTAQTLERLVPLAIDPATGTGPLTSQAELDRVLGYLDLARQIRTDQIRINGAAVATDAPFGGHEQSGMGREYGPEGVTAFLETKAIADRPT